MKYFAFLIITIFCSQVFAGNWVGKSKFKNPTVSWSSQALCQVKESEKCFEITNVDTRRFKIGFATPVVLETRECSDATDCQAMIDDLDQPFSCGEFETPTFDDKANWPSLDFASEGRPATGWFLWCQKEIRLVDAAGSAAADAEDAQAAADQTARENARGPRLADLQACVQDSKNPTLSPDQIKNCIAALVREVLGNRVAPADL